MDVVDRFWWQRIIKCNENSVVSMKFMYFFVDNLIIPFKKNGSNNEKLFKKQNRSSFDEAANNEINKIKLLRSIICMIEIQCLKISGNHYIPIGLNQ